MELPFTVVFEPPSRTELRAMLRMRRTWAAGVLVVLAIGTAALGAGLGRSDAVASGAVVPLELSSRPPGAGVWLDGHERGHTPLELPVEAGAHAVVLRARDALDGRYAVQVGAEPTVLEAVLWRRQPSLVRLRPSLPGAVLADARPLANGELALSMALPLGHQMQAWRLDPWTGALTPVLTDVAAARLSVAPDGERVALVGYDLGPPGPHADASETGSTRPSVLWLYSGQQLASTAAWRPPLELGERLLDASWSPRGDQLLVVTGQDLPGGARSSRLWLVDAQGQAGREVLSVPSEIAPGSEVWSPDGQYVSLLAHAGMVNALCLLALDGGFRYVADLEPTPAPPAFLPATWAPDSKRLVFIAPHQHPPGGPAGWLQPERQRGLYFADTTDPTLHQVGDTDMDFAAWREDGQVVGLGRVGANHILAVRLLDGSASTQASFELPLSPGSNYSAVWDLPRARLLLASPTSSGGVDYWVAMFGLEGEQ
ncbi:MAG: PEGA domain-containing protein [Chloroflexota bacterium]